MGASSSSHPDQTANGHVPMRPTMLEIFAAAVPFIVLAGMVAVIVLATIPPDGVRTLR